LGCIAHRTNFAVDRVDKSIGFSYIGHFDFLSFCMR
jgi:hypothetical protein